jgi:hypothetical protein
VRYFYVLAKRELLAGQIADLLREATGIVTSVTGTEVCLELIYFPFLPFLSDTANFASPQKRGL